MSYGTKYMKTQGTHLTMSSNDHAAGVRVTARVVFGVHRHVWDVHRSFREQSGEGSEGVHWSEEYDKISMRGLGAEG